jgi:hypothetical protein
LPSVHHLTILPPIDTGANASAEEAEEGLEDEVRKVNNIVSSFRLQATSFDKKSYLTYLKGTPAPLHTRDEDPDTELTCDTQAT